MWMDSLACTVICAKNTSYPACTLPFWHVLGGIFIITLINDCPMWMLEAWRGGSVLYFFIFIFKCSRLGYCEVLEVYFWSCDLVKSMQQQYCTLCNKKSTFYSLIWNEMRLQRPISFNWTLIRVYNYLIVIHANRKRPNVLHNTNQLCAWTHFSQGCW